MSGFFVYVGDTRYTWRFVYYSPIATSGIDAIKEAWREAIDSDQHPEGNYMAVPHGQITTLKAEAHRP